MRLVCDNIVLRHATVEDSKQLATWWNDGSVMEHAGFPHGLGITEEEVKESIKTDSDETGRRLIIEFQDRLIGEMNYRNQGNHIAEIGIKICEAAYQEKGIGRCVLQMLIQYLFQNGYRKIVLDTDLNNKRAQHVYEILGFRKVRVNINVWKNQVGEMRSSVDYELTEEEFNERSKIYR